MSDHEGLERRQVLSGLGAGLLATGIGVGQTSGGSHDVTVTLNNQGASAWVLDSAGENVGETGVPNPALTLTVGTRYRFENLGWSFHPLAFRDEADNALLTQSTYGSGSFENDSAVNWVDNGEELAFTVTESLAAEFDDYVCTVHPSMEGNLGAQAPQEAPFFAVQSPSPQSAVVTKGETVELSATIENTGDVEETQAIAIEIDGFGEIGSQSQTLAGGIANDVSFLVDTADIDPGEYTYTFVSDDDEASGSLTVESAPDPPSFRVATVTPSEVTVTQGETVTVDATVENTGDEEGTQEVVLDIPGLGQIGAQSVTLAGGGADSVTFEVDTTGVDPGEYTHIVSTDDETFEGVLTVESSADPVASFEVSGLSPADGTVEQGETVTAEATVENTGDAEGSQSVTFSVVGTDISVSRTVTLAAGESTTTSFDLDTTDVPAGEYTHQVESEDSSVTGALTVQEPPDPAEFRLSALDPTTASVTQGEELAVTVSVENTGEQEATQDVVLSVSGLGDVASESVTLAGGGSDSVSFTVDTTDVPTGEYTHTVSTDDGSTEGSLTVQEPPDPAEFRLSALDPTTASVTQGEELAVTVSVENTGEQEATQDVVLSVSGLGDVASESVTLAGGGSDSVSFTVDTTDVPTGEYTHTVSTDDGSAEGSLTILASTPEDDSANGDGAGGENTTDGGDSDGENTTDGADGNGPGFGPLAGLTALGGLAAYAARRLGVADDTDD
jgi:uncharacterized membrane protein